MSEHRKKHLTIIIIVASVLIGTISTRAQAQSLSFTEDRAWINSVGTLLYSDPDLDGFFSGISLSIDADTRFQSLELFATIDIIDELNVTERLLTTRPFHIYERRLSDEHRVDIDLVQNFFPGDYDLLISIVEEGNNRILDSVSARDFRNLRALPLESEDNDSSTVTPINNRPQPSNDDIRVTEFAGGTGFGLIAGFMLIGALRFRAAKNNEP